MDEVEANPTKLGSNSRHNNAGTFLYRPPSTMLMPSSRAAISKTSWTPATIFISFIFLLTVCLVIFYGNHVVRNNSRTLRHTNNTTIVVEYPSLNCSSDPKCPVAYPTIQDHDDRSPMCPDYFRWLHEDLRPWRDSGITRQVLESNNKTWAHFRFIVSKGKPYLQTFRQGWQSRDVLTIWGLLQLLRVYPGRIPDLEIIFCCEDVPAVKKQKYDKPGSPKPPPLFRYCGANSTFDIPFPDWSFWGWPELNIEPWENTLRGIEEKAEKVRWEDREPYAYWKGNPHVSRKRGELMQCRPDKDRDWKARLYEVNWGKESSSGFNDSRLEDQCTHRYKIYVEGRSWSVSEKYILACDAMTLLIKPEFYDFFVRGMIPMQHYWPIRPHNKCKDIKFAVDWGNTHPQQAQEIGKGGTKFATKNISMQYVYDYMFHVLNEYAKLQKYEVTVPPDAVEICAETMACSATGLVKKFMEDSLVKAPNNGLPCTLPPPYDPQELKAFKETKENISRQVGFHEVQSLEKRSNQKTWNPIMFHFFLVFVVFLSLVVSTYKNKRSRQYYRDLVKIKLSLF